MEIRKARPTEIGQIMEVYAAAKEFMQQTGNGNQWVNGYPSEELIMNDIRDGNFFVCVLPGEEIAGVFCFRIGEDPTYRNIYEGSWLNDEPYGVLHRLGGNGKIKGLADRCMEWCFEQSGNVRVDTHRENRVMQHILKKHGYVYCGIIHLANGSERLAFQKCGNIS